jgi:hypothetical protein
MQTFATPRPIGDSYYAPPKDLINQFEKNTPKNYALNN